MATNKESLIVRLRAMRFNDNKHLGLGDVRLTLWEQEQIEKEFADLEARLATAEAEVVRLRGQVAALKGRVPDLPVVFRRGDPLPRFGIRWSSPTEPICVPMDDGYWTVWHYADAALAEIVRERNDYRSSFAKSRDDELSVAQEIDELRAKLAECQAVIRHKGHDADCWAERCVICGNPPSSITNHYFGPLPSHNFQPGPCSDACGHDRVVGHD